MSKRTITSNHGAGGRVMQEFIRDSVLSKIGNPTLNRLDDCAVLDNPGSRLAFTTDSYVVSPISFPGGDIGKLAVCGTCNDLATSGARVLGMSLSLIIEEGTPIRCIDDVVDSIAATARSAEVEIVTGDTKVVERGKGDLIYINTAAVGIIDHDATITSASAVPGDQVYVTGPIGNHEIAMMQARDSLPTKLEIESDVEALNLRVQALLGLTQTIHTIKDPTRGGVASVLNEISSHSHVEVHLDEASIPLDSQVSGICKLLGLDPLYLACEGRYVMVAPKEAAPCIREVFPEATLIGEVRECTDRPRVLLSTLSGGIRRIGSLETTQFPRIC